MVKRLVKNQAWIWIAIILGFIGVSFFGANNEPKEYPPYVSHSPSPTGTKALFTYLDEQDYQVEQWEQSPELLGNKEENQLLIMIEPMFIPSGEEITQYEQFMKQGNTILLFSEQPANLFNVETTFADIFEDEENEGLTLEDHQYEINIDPMERLVIDDEDETLVHDDTGTYAMNRPYDNGNLIVVNFADWMINDQIIEADQGELVLELIDTSRYETGAILFDEFVHEGSQTKTFINAYPFWFLVLIFQGIVLTLVWLFYKGKRFGPVFTPREDEVRFSDEGITALASWYMRGRRYLDSLAIQADYVKHLLQDHWGIPYQSSWLDTKSALKQRWHHPPKDVDKLINELDTVLSEQSIKKNQYVQWSKILDQLRKEVEEG